MKKLIRKMTRNVCFFAFATVAYVAASSLLADTLPWDGTRLVFDEEQRDGAFTLGAPATASMVDFRVPATLRGDTLTLTSPALVRGGGALLTPLAGSDGIVVGWPVQTHAPFFGQSEYRTLWNGVDLSTVTNVTGCFCGEYSNSQLTPALAVAYKRLNAEGTSATVQLQTCDIGSGHWVRCFQLQLDQDGDDVKAKALWCKYAAYPEKASYYGRDWDDPDIRVDGEYNAWDFSTAVNGSGIGVTNVKPLFDVDLEGTLPSGQTVLNGHRVTFRPTQAVTMASAFTGEVQEVVFKGNKPDVREYHQDGWIMTDSEVLVAQNTSITSIRFKSAIMCGNWVACSDPSLFGSYSSISGDTLTMQVQCYVDNGPGNQYTKAVFVEFRQAGKDVYMKAVAMGFNSGDCRGSGIPRTSDPVCTSGSLSNPTACNGGYGLYDVTFTYTPDTWPLKFSASSRDILDKGTRYVFDGVDATGNQNATFSDYSTIILTNNSVLTGFVWQDPLSLVISTGCQVTVNTDWALTRNGNVDMTIDGGTFQADNYSCYANYVTLANGGRVIGSLMRVGAYNQTNITTTLAGSPCYIQKLNGARQESGTAVEPFSNWHEFRLAADLYVGGLDDVSGWEGLNWEKKGPADMHITNASGTTGAFRICEGAIVFDCNGALGMMNALELAGGEIDVGVFTNRLGVLTVKENSAIRTGDGCLTFSDSSSAVWTPGAMLSVTGSAERLMTGHVRFVRENGAAGLSNDQLRAIRYNGKLRVRLDDDGWLESYIPGIVIKIR